MHLAILVVVASAYLGHPELEQSVLFFVFVQGWKKQLEECAQSFQSAFLHGMGAACGTCRWQSHGRTCQLTSRWAMFLGKHFLSWFCSSEDAVLSLLACSHGPFVFYAWMGIDLLDHGHLIVAYGACWPKGVDETLEIRDHA